MRKSGRIKYELYLVLATLFWGASFLWNEHGLSQIDLLTFMFYRFLVALIVMILIFFKSFKHFSWKGLLGGIALGFIMFGAGILQTSGQLFTSPEKSAFITSLQVLVVPFVAFFFFKRKPGMYSVIGTIFAFIGLILITLGTSSNGLSGGWGLGETLTLLSAFLYGLHIIFVGKYSKENDPLFISIIQIASTCALFLIAALVTGSKPIPMTWSAWTPVLFIGICATAGSFSLMLIGQKKTPPTKAAVIYAMEPVFAFIIGLVIPTSDGKYATFNALTVIGGLAVVLGVITSETGSAKSHLNSSKGG